MIPLKIGSGKAGFCSESDQDPETTLDAPEDAFRHHGRYTRLGRTHGEIPAQGLLRPISLYFGFSRTGRRRALGSFYTQGCRGIPVAFGVRKGAEKGALVGCETEHDGHESRETNPSSESVDCETRRTNPVSKFDEHKTRRTNPDSGSLRSRNATNEPNRQAPR
jgi:hypothetical protein